MSKHQTIPKEIRNKKSRAFFLLQRQNNISYQIILLGIKDFIVFCSRVIKRFDVAGVQIGISNGGFGC